MTDSASSPKGPMHARVLFLLLVGFPLITSNEQRLVQIQVIVRHGSRKQLSKSADTLEEGSSGLTPTGEKQMYDLGSWLRERYSGQDFSLSYDASQVLIESSPFGRSVVSAQSLALGLFPASSRNATGETLLPADVTPANIPVFTKKDENDIYIRAYANCPAFHAALQEFYTTDSFQDYHTQNLLLLTKLGERESLSAYTVITDSLRRIVPVYNVWNAFDAINVAKTECNPPSRAECASLEDPDIRDFLTAVEWDQLQRLAHSVEHEKYGVGIAGSKLGANILHQIRDRMQSSALTPWFIYSGHFATILGIFSALDVYALNEATLGQETIPNYGSALIFEVYEATGSGRRSVQLFFKEGLQNGVVQLTLPPEFCDSTSCALENFSKYVESRVDIADSQQWCSACQNSEADVCILAQSQNNSNTCDNNESESSAMIAVSFVMGVVLGVLLLLGGAFIYTCFKNSKSTPKRSSSSDRKSSPPDDKNQMDASLPASIVLEEAKGDSVIGELDDVDLGRV